MIQWGTARDGRPIFEHPLECPECRAKMVLRRTQKFTWKNGEGRLFYGCSRWPQCSGIHGAHPSGAPLGVPATLETKRARQRAHEQFDALILEAHWLKRQGYHWLGQKLGMKDGREIRDKCHISMFDLDTCNRVAILCRAKRDKIAASNARRMEMGTDVPQN